MVMANPHLLFAVPDININFVDRDPECLLSAADIMGTAGQQPVAVYITVDDDSIGISLALRVRRVLGSDATPVIVCMRSSLSELIKGKEARFMVIKIFMVSIYMTLPVAIRY